MVSNVVTWSQSKETIDKDDYILIPKTTHEELRKNIEDYRALITTYEKLKIEYDAALQSNTIDKEKVIAYQNQLISLREQLLNYSKKIDDLENRLKELSVKYAKLDEYYTISKKNNDRYRAEIYQIKGYKNRFQTQGVIIGFLAVALIVVIAQQ